MPKATPLHQHRWIKHRQIRSIHIIYIYIDYLLFIYIHIYEHANPIRPDFQPGSTNFSFSISHLSVSWRLTGFNFIWGELRILYCFFLVWCGPKGISLDEGTNLALIAICASYERCRPMIFMKMYLFSWYICPAERDSFSRTVPKSAPCFPDIMCVLPAVETKHHTVKPGLRPRSCRRELCSRWRIWILMLQLFACSLRRPKIIDILAIWDYCAFLVCACQMCDMSIYTHVLHISYIPKLCTCMHVKNMQCSIRRHYIIEISTTPNKTEQNDPCQN